jgi:hypothetical protein
MGAVAKMRPVLAALVMLTPNVKAVWPITTPRRPKPATGRRSFGLNCRPAPGGGGGRTSGRRLQRSAKPR